MGWLPPSCVPYRYFENNSSPHGRGKRERSRRGGAGWRLIPARAGKTSHGPDHRLASTAHPRAGGENGYWRGQPIGEVGSSPHGRGKPPAHCWQVQGRGLIPAWAGKTRPGCVPDLVVRAHPRMGGENQIGLVNREVKYGSSPRGRGKPPPAYSAIRGIGFIPAWAGKTSSILRTRSRAWAHPRVGGENHPRAHAFDLNRGSSPHGRGKHREGVSPP